MPIFSILSIATVISTSLSGRSISSAMPARILRLLSFDKLLFKILNSGDFLSGMDREELVGEEPLRVAARICDAKLQQIFYPHK